MRPTLEQVRKAAYERWERRGKDPGTDQQDWFAAEGRLRFALNYEIVATDRTNSARQWDWGDTRERKCRFCGMAAPRVGFSAPVPALPGFLGRSSILAHDQCDDCLALFEPTIDDDFEGFALDLLASVPSAFDSIPIGAFKGLVRLALGISPDTDLESYEDTIEWISNPDHNFDRNAFQGLSCTLYKVGSAFPSSWAVLARRRDHTEPLPYLLFFLGFAETILQLTIPLGQRDEDQDGHEADRFDLSPPALFGIAHEPIRRLTLPIRIDEQVS
jgi:hypothetical protein